MEAAFEAPWRNFKGAAWSSKNHLHSAKRGRDELLVGAAFQQPWGVENEGEERERGFLYRHMERTS